MLVLFDAPVTSVSGYGAHARDLLRALIKEYPDWNIKVSDRRWGDTPRNALVSGKDDEITSRFLTESLYRKPDMYIQVTVPTEFTPVGAFNIGVTAGIETTVADAKWVEGCNRMDMTIVTSKHSKDVFLNSIYQVADKNTGAAAGTLKISKPMEVLFEGTDTSVYYKTNNIHKTIADAFDKIPSDFAFLVVGHWLNGGLGHDRKDIGMVVKTYMDMFGRKQNPPALIMKTSGATFSAIDREMIVGRVSEITGRDNNLPIYVLHGDLSDEEMNSVYNHPKVKALISFTHGECYGRPLQEFALSGKPVIASNWSGQLDFLNPKYSVLLPGAVKQVHPSAVWKGVINHDTGWFYVDYFMAQRIIMDVYKNYKKYAEMGDKQRQIIEKHFSLEAMASKLKEILDAHSSSIPQEQVFKMPIAPSGQTLSPVMPKLKRM